MIDDFELLARLRAGDRSAGTLLIKRNLPRLFEWSWQHCGHELGEEVTTATLNRLIHGTLPAHECPLEVDTMGDPYRTDPEASRAANFDNWLLTLAKNQLRRVLRAQLHRDRLVGRSRRLHRWRWSRQDLRRRLFEGEISKLPTDQQEVARLRYLEGYGLDEIMRESESMPVLVCWRLYGATKSLAQTCAGLRRDERDPDLRRRRARAVWSEFLRWRIAKVLRIPPRHTHDGPRQLLAAFPNDLR